MKKESLNETRDTEEKRDAMDTFLAGLMMGAIGSSLKKDHTADYEGLAKEIYNIYRSLIAAGFDNATATELLSSIIVKITINGGGK